MKQTQCSRNTNTNVHCPPATHVCPQRLVKNLAWSFQRRLSNCPVIQHSWL